MHADYIFLVIIYVFPGVNHSFTFMFVCLFLVLPSLIEPERVWKYCKTCHMPSTLGVLFVSLFSLETFLWNPWFSCFNLDFKLSRPDIAVKLRLLFTDCLRIPFAQLLYVAPSHKSQVSLPFGGEMLKGSKHFVTLQSENAFIQGLDCHFGKIETS